MPRNSQGRLMDILLGSWKQRAAEGLHRRFFRVDRYPIAFAYTGSWAGREFSGSKSLRLGLYAYFANEEGSTCPPALCPLPKPITEYPSLTIACKSRSITMLLVLCGANSYPI